MNQAQQFSIIFKKYGYTSNALDLSQDIDILYPLIKRSIFRNGFSCSNVLEMVGELRHVDRQIFNERLLEDESIDQTILEAKEHYTCEIDDGYLKITGCFPPSLCMLRNNCIVDVSESAASELVEAGYGIKELNILVGDKIRIVSCRGYRDDHFHPNVSMSGNLCLGEFNRCFDIANIHRVIDGCQHFNLIDTYFRVPRIEEVTKIVTQKEEHI